MQADANDVVVIHWIAYSACVGSANKEAHCKGLETSRGMPGGSHSLPICLAIFSRCSDVLCDEPVEHVEKDRVWLFHADWLVCLQIAFERFERKTWERFKLMVTMSDQVFWSQACVAFKLLRSSYDVYAEKSGMSSTSFGKGK